MKLSKRHIAFNFILLIFTFSSFCMQNDEKNEARQEARRFQGCSLKKIVIGCLALAGSMLGISQYLHTTIVKSPHDLYVGGSYRLTCEDCIVFHSLPYITCAKCKCLTGSGCLIGYTSVDGRDCADNGGTDIANQNGRLKCIKSKCVTWFDRYFKNCE